MKKLLFEQILRYGRLCACLKSSCILPKKVFGSYSVTFLGKHLYVNGVWLGKGLKTNTVETHVQKSLDYIYKFYFLLYTQDTEKLEDFEFF